MLNEEDHCRKIIVDLLSDTGTLPTSGMLSAMANAALGDDGYGEDPTVAALERKAASRLGKPAGCFFPSGTMANLCALLAHCGRGAEVLVGDLSDIYNYEAGGGSVVGGLVLHPVKTSDNGELDLDDLARAFRDKSDFQCAPPGVLCLENPHNLRGGRVISVEHLKTARSVARSAGIPVHMDGARLFNAEVATGVRAAAIAAHADSVQFCLSKSLSAPIGSLLVGNIDFIDRARRARKMLGGTMRQAGVVAAAGIVALDEMVDRLGEDHRRAKEFACRLQSIQSIACDLAAVETNMVYFELSDRRITQSFLLDLMGRGIRMSELGHGRIRAAFHRGIDDEMLSLAVSAVRESVAHL